MAMQNEPYAENQFHTLATKLFRYTDTTVTEVSSVYILIITCFNQLEQELRSYGLK